MPLLPRPEIRDLTICRHGGIDYAELEMLDIRPQGILDFSANLNPFGPSPKVMQAIYDISRSNLTEAISQYPDSEARSLRHSLADKLRISTNNIIVTNGSTELIRLAALAYFGRGDNVLIIDPTYCEYELACRIAGASVIKQQLSADGAFLPNINETIDLIKQYHPKGVFVCNPNNPTGRYLSRTDFERILDAGNNSLVVLDEAYVSFVDNLWSSLDMVEGTNLLVLRSMTKDYALAGLRLGYGVAREEIITTLRHVCPPWNVNALAQKAGIIAVVEEAYLERRRTELIEAKNYLVMELSRLGLRPLPSETHFFLVEVGNATEFRRELLKQRMLVRDCSSFGLPEYIRIAPRTLPECHMLVGAIKEIEREHNEQFFMASVKTNKAPG